MELVELLVDKIKTFFPSKIAESHKNKLAKLILSQVSEEELNELTPFELRTLVEETYRDYETSKVEPGKMVGVIASQSLGEVLTQASMNSHRTAGLASGREQYSGLARLLQIIHNTQPQVPSMFLYPKERMTLNQLKRFIAKLQYTLVDDLLKDTTIDELPPLPFYDAYEKLYGKVEKAKYVLRLQFDVQKLYDKRITLSSVSKIIETGIRNVKTLHSNIALGIIDVHYNGTGVMENYQPFTKVGEESYYYVRDNILVLIKGLHVSGITGIDKVFLNSIPLSEVITGIVELPKQSGSSNKTKYNVNVNTKLSRAKGIQIEWIHEWFFEQLDGDAEWISDYVFLSTKSRDYIGSNLNNEEVSLPQLLDKSGQLDEEIVTKHGLTIESVISYLRINNPQLIEEGDKLSPSSIKERGITFVSQYRQFLGEFWFIETRGINLEEISFFPEINHLCTWCNNGDIVYNTYGIEAARMWQETEAQEAGMSSVSYEHRTLLFDTSTRDGIVLSLTRHGLEQMNFEFLTHSNFEQNTMNFLNSAYSGRSDSLSGIASSVITGKLADAGTNFSELVYDPKIAENMEKRVNPPKGKGAPRKKT
jgi:DNA-directed RNA polymerase beta' subunit